MHEYYKMLHIWCMVYLVFIYSMCLCLAVVISVMHIRYGRPWLPLFTIECIYYGTDNQILRLPCTSRVLRQEQRQNRKRKRKHFAESSIAVTSRLPRRRRQLQQHLHLHRFDQVQCKVVMLDKVYVSARPFTLPPTFTLWH